MKKTLAFLSMAIMVIGFMFSPIEASANEVSDNNKESVLNEDNFKFAAGIVEKYYKHKDLGENNDFSKDVSADVQKLLDTKIELGQIQNKVLDLSYKDYQIEINPHQTEKWEENENEIFMIIRVERGWFYSSEQTTSSQLLEITLSKSSNGELKLVSCYEPYEDVTLGPIDQLFQDAKVLRVNTDVLLENYIKDFEEQSIQKNEQLILDAQESVGIDKNAEFQLNAKTYLNRTDIRDWARNNYDENAPTSSSSSVPYYDFSELSGAWDCTNFASHALLAGGATLHDDGGSGIVGTGQWYYRSSANRSSSWAGVDQLYQFLTRSNPSNTNIGPYGTSKTLTYANAFLGDIVQGHNGTIWRHSTVVTKFENSKVYVTGRTGDGVYNDNVLATTIYGTQRLIALDGNYN
ncbi:hypothetical protein J2T13_005309 [Paenibacillus sp. DS2015]|uniref:amidase domain-containing protein n=1 Tax=Paenibacillus sp. DS2015 TaxID=3373917 RepID=UPI003D210911